MLGLEFTATWLSLTSYSFNAVFIVRWWCMCRLVGFSFANGQYWTSSRRSTGRAVPPNHHHNLVLQTFLQLLAREWLGGLRDCHFPCSLSCRPQPVTAAPAETSPRHCHNKLNPFQNSTLFLPVSGLKHGVSPGCGSAATHARLALCAPTLSCMCAHKKHSPAHFVFQAWEASVWRERLTKKQ